MADHELATQWDPDHRLAATVAFAAGIGVAVGAASWLTVGQMLGGDLMGGQDPGAFAITLMAAVLLLTDVALLVFVVALAFAFTTNGSFGLVATTAVATLATTGSATLHLIWGHLAASLEIPEQAIPGGVSDFVSWLALNLWLMPLFGLLVGATLLALSLALRVSSFSFARGLGKASAVVGGILCVLAPFTGFGPDQMALLAVAATLVAAVGITGLLLVALVGLGRLLWGTRGQPRAAA